MMENINIFAFADEADSNIDGQIIAMKRNRLKGLEIRGVDGENISNISIEKAKIVKEKLDSNGLLVWSIGSPIGKINITDDFSKHLDKFKHTLEVSNVLESSNMRIFSFYTPENEPKEKYKNQVIENLQTMCDIAKPYGVILLHENEKGIYGDITERCLEIHKAIPDLKGIFDPANFVQCGVDTLKAWELLKEYIFYMHIKDATKDGFVVPSGFGAGNVKAIVTDFISRGGNSFTIEPHLTVFDGFNNLEKNNDSTIIKEFTYGSNNEAFDTACNTFKELVAKI